MIIGISMGQETCQILGQVSLNLLYCKKNLQNDLCGPGRRSTRKQLTSRPDHLWPELWKTMGKNAKLNEKRKWSNEKLHLENARKLRGIYFIDPEDKEFKETFKNARKKLETPIALAMRCKIMKKNCGSGASNKIKTRLACILEAGESTKLRMGNHYQIIMKIILQEKGTTHYSIIIWFPNLFLCLKPSKFQQQRQQWTRNGKNGKNFGVEPDKSQK